MAKTKQKTHKIIQKEIRRLKTKPLIAGINKLRPVCFDKWKGLEVQKQKLEVPTHYYNEHTQEFINKSSCRIIACIAPAIDSTKRAIAEYRIISRNIINAEETADSESGQRALAVALGLAVCSDGRGTIIQNQIKILENGKEDIITGLVEGSAKEAFFVAKAVAASVIGTKEEKTYAYHSCDASVKKDGSSAGLTLSMAMLSSYYNKDLTGFSFTGEIDLCGNVHAIGGVYQKLEASNDSSAIKTVYIPMANYKKLALSDELKCFENIKIVGVSTVAELAKEVFG